MCAWNIVGAASLRNWGMLEGMINVGSDRL